MSSTLLIDTHVFVWSMMGQAHRLGKSTRKALEEAVPGDRKAIVAITLWEIAMLSTKGRLSFNLPVANWIDQAVARTATQIVDLSIPIAVESTALPGEFHGDPADRMIVATARHLDATLITADRAILAYGAGGHVRTLDASR
jgi:PIN domain nuclease of toxin-antitoxin system